MRILVTGASGFVGRPVVARLKVRHKLLTLSRSTGDDISRLPRLKKKIRAFNPEVCIHLAWSGIPDYSFAMSKKNLDDSLRFMEFITEETSCRKIVATGTCFEYGKNIGRCQESDMTRTHSYLGWAKKSLYDYLECACAKKKIDLTWFRLFYVYGPGQREQALIPSALKAIREGRAPAVTFPNNANDYVHVSDVADAVAGAVRPGAATGVFNLGSGRATKAADVCRMVERAFSGKTSLTRDLKRGARPATMNFWADMAKSRRLLKHKTRIPLQEGIADYVNQARGNP